MMVDTQTGQLSNGQTTTLTPAQKVFVQAVVIGRIVRVPLFIIAGIYAYKTFVK